MRWLVDAAYPDVPVVRMVPDDLNTHRMASLYETFMYETFMYEIFIYEIFYVRNLLCTKPSMYETFLRGRLDVSPNGWNFTTPPSRELAEYGGDCIQRHIPPLLWAAAPEEDSLCFSLAVSRETGPRGAIALRVATGIIAKMPTSEMPACGIIPTKTMRRTFCYEGQSCRIMGSWSTSRYS